MKKCQIKKNEKAGVSLITLVITIIVIIILVAVTIYTSLTTVDNANYASFAAEYDEVNSGTQAVLRNNVLNGNSEEARNQGFKKVSVENPPGNFASVDEDALSGYLVDMDTIKVSGTKTGKGTIIGDEVVFGRDDVYIYDSKGTVYYAKGFYDGEGNLRYRLDEIEDINNKPAIALIEYNKNDDKSIARVTVVANPVNGGVLTVTGGGKTATNVGGNVYEFDIDKNGTIIIIVRESGGGSTIRELTITGLEKAKYTLTYDMNGGVGSIAAQTKEKGNTIYISSIIPTREHYIFKGWGTSSTSDAPEYQPGAKYTKDENVTLYAIWEGVKYKITYNVNGGSGTNITKEKEHGKPITLSTTIPTRTGFEFKGWGISSSDSTPIYQPGGTYSLDEDITLYAIWEVLTYEIKYDLNGGTGTFGSQVKNYSQDITLSDLIPTREGYEFIGWAESSTAESATYQPGATFTKDSNATLYAVWKVLTYKIKYDANGGTSAPAEQIKEHRKTILLTTEVPSREGYTFMGWAETSTATVATYKAGASFNENGNKTLYAVWSAIKYTVTFDANGGNGAPSAQEKTHGQNLTLSSTKPTKTGYTFLGWSINSSSTTAEYLAGGTFDKNESTTLYAVWKIETYVVTYNANGGTNAPISQTKTYNQILKLSTDIPQRVGYTFKGWATSETSTVVNYKAGGDYTDNKEITLYAVWEEIVYEITYDLNGGTIDTAIAKQTKKYNQEIVLSSSRPSKRRYTFIGWAISKNATEANYQPGDKYTSNEDVVLYAVWKGNLIGSIANEPIVGDGMLAVYWDNDNATTEYTSGYFTDEMYSYKMGDGVTDTKESRWANAITTADGSYWVWIPRYAYKIIYYTDSTRNIETTTKTQYGDIDVLFMYDTSDTQYRDANGNAVDLPEGYKVHPAFQSMTEEELAGGKNPLGKWDSELTGLWVMKYEASREDSTDGGSTWLPTTASYGGGDILTTNAGNTATTKIRVVSKPSVPSWRGSHVSNSYKNCLAMYTKHNTHQMKNSEWGAVAYLTYSAYGRNGEELAVNQNNDGYTGAGKSKGTSLVYELLGYSYSKENKVDGSGKITAYAFDENYAWNTTLGKLASSTGNIYGVYDLSGGSYEYTSSYLDNGSSKLTAYGANLVNDTNLRYKQVYSSTVTDGSYAPTADYEINSDKYGDAIQETCPQKGYDTCWCNDRGQFPESSYNFFTRGGASNENKVSGIFNFDSYPGGYGAGFRAVIACSET